MFSVSSPRFSDEAAVLVFELARTRCGVAARAVHEVIRAVAITPVSSTVPWLEGVIDVRGTVIPVLDIRERLGLPAATLHPDQHFLLVDAGTRRVALRVDRALDLIHVTPAALEPASAAPGARRVAGIARHPDGLVIIQDLDAFLSLDEGRLVDAAMPQVVRESVAPRTPNARHIPGPP